MYFLANVKADLRGFGGVPESVAGNMFVKMILSLH